MVSKLISNWTSLHLSYRVLLCFKTVINSFREVVYLGCGSGLGQQLVIWDLYDVPFPWEFLFRIILTLQFLLGSAATGWLAGHLAGPTILAVRLYMQGPRVLTRPQLSWSVRGLPGPCSQQHCSHPGIDGDRDEDLIQRRTQLRLCWAAMTSPPPFFGLFSFCIPKGRAQLVLLPPSRTSEAPSL